MACRRVGRINLGTGIENDAENREKGKDDFEDFHK
jgi:hypothetical protein